MEPSQLSLWASLCICFVVLSWDYWNRCQSITYSVLQKRLNIVSFLVMITIMLDIIQNIFFSYSIFCKYINFQTIPTEALTATLISLYQVTRLHYSFNNELNHLNWSFIHRILYIIPIFWFIYMIAIDEIRFTIQLTENATCILVAAITSPAFWILSIIAMPFRYGYDCFVVYIYVNRVQKLVNYNQQTAESKSGKTAENIAIRMLILTIVIVIITIIHGIISIINITTKYSNFQYQIFVYTFDCVKRVVVCFSVFLMLRHNTITYQNFIQSNCSNCLKTKINGKNGENGENGTNSKNIYKKIPLIYMARLNGPNTEGSRNITSENCDSSSSSLNPLGTAVAVYNTYTIRNIDENSIFPRFDLDEKYIKQSKIVFMTLMKLKLAGISIPEVATIISEYAPTTYRPCIECGETFGYIDCCYDYFIVNCALANCDPTQNDAIRYYLNGDGSFSTNIQNDINHYDEEIDVLCVKCGEEWQCNVCETQFCSYSYESILINGGCDLCSNVTCQDCSTVYDDKVVCFNCCPSKNSSKSKSYQTITINDTSMSNIKSSITSSSTTPLNSPVNNNNNNNNTGNISDSKWGSFNFSDLIDEPKIALSDHDNGKQIK